MAHRLPVPASPAFEAIARGAQFRDRIAIVVKRSPQTIFQALREVTLRDMKLAWLVGEQAALSRLMMFRSRERASVLAASPPTTSAAARAGSRHGSS
jgi:hypothetical protein